MSTIRHLLFVLALSLGLTRLAFAATFDLETATIADINAAFDSGALTSEKLVTLYLARIAAYDQKGPALNTIITLNPRALEEAKALDAERKKSGPRSPLHGMAVVLKDNIDTHDLPTTAGSQLLHGSIPPDDAFVVKKLRDAGAIILAKVNLGEFAAGGGGNGVTPGATPPPKPGSTPVGSTEGGLTLNPHDLTRTSSGSSGGTAVAIAAVFTTVGLGTDTGGSTRNPSSANGIVGLRPTMGLLSRDGVIPFALSFDMIGPMARNVADVAALLSTMTGVDAADPITKTSTGHLGTDYTSTLKRGALRGARIGVAREFFGRSAETDAVMETAIAKLKELGATIVDPVGFPTYAMQARAEIWRIMGDAEFKAQIADYLRTLKPGFPRTLAEMATRASDPTSGYSNVWRAYGFQRTDETALALTDPVYLAAKDEGVALVRAGVNAVFAANRLDAIVYPTAPTPARPLAPPSATPSSTTPIGSWPTAIASVTGYPDLAVPAGMSSDRLPVTISLLGQPWSEAKLLGYGYDFEQATKARVLPKYTPALPGDTITY